MYKITIERITIMFKKVDEWNRMHNKIDFDNTKDPQYTYVSVNKEVTDTKEIYTQQTDKEIDIKKVIDAFNQ